MSNEKYSEEELSMLTDEERAALLDGDDEDDEVPEVIPGEQNDAADDDANKEAAGKDGAAVAADPAGDGAGAVAAPVTEPELAAAAQVTTDEPPAKALAPILVAEIPTDADAKLAAIEAKRSDLEKQKREARTQYNDGTIDFDRYEEIKDQIDATKDKLADEKLELRTAIDRANLAETMRLQAQQNAWYEQAGAFAEKHGYSANPILFKAFEGQVIEIAQSEAGQAMQGYKILEEAHSRMVAAGLGKAAPAAAAAPAAPVAKGKAARPVQPPNLAVVPAADTSEAAGGNRFARLDQLQSSGDVEAYEAALSKMSEADQDAYMRA